VLPYTATLLQYCYTIVKLSYYIAVILRYLCIN